MNRIRTATVAVLLASFVGLPTAPVQAHDNQGRDRREDRRDRKEDRRDRKIFAKLTSYSKGTLTFIEPDGTRSRTKEDSLSDKDRAWITEQKKLRNLQ